MLTTPTISISTYSSTSTSNSFPIINSNQFKIINKVINSLPSKNSFTWSDLELTYTKLNIIEEDYYNLFLKLSSEEGKNWNLKWESIKNNFNFNQTEDYHYGYNDDDEIHKDRIEEEEEEEEERIQEDLREQEIKIEKDRIEREQQFTLFQARLAQFERGHSPPKSINSIITRTASIPPQPTKEIPYTSTSLLNQTTKYNPSSTSATQSIKPTRDFLIQTRFEDDDYNQQVSTSSEDDYVARSIPTPPLTYSNPAAPPSSKHTRSQSMQPTNTYDYHPPPPILPALDLIPSISPTLQTKLLTQSQALRNSFLSSQYYSIWRNRFLYLRSRSDQISLGANKFLVREVFEKWRRITRERRALEEWEVGWKERESMRCLILWGRRWKERKVGRYKMELREVRDIVEDRREKELLEGVLVKWRHQTQTSLSTSFYTSHLLSSILQHWFNRCRSIEELEIRADSFNRSIYWREWGLRLREKGMERDFREEREGREKRGVLEYWRGRMQDRALLKRLDLAAVQFRQASLLSIWKDRFLSIQALELPCSEFISVRNEALLHSTFTNWSLTSLATQFRTYQLSLSTPLLLSKCLKKWRNQFRFNNIELQGRSIAFKLHFEKKKNHFWFLVWRREFKFYNHSLPSLAKTFLHSSEKDLVRYLWREWKDRFESRKLREVKGDLARDHFLLRGAFGKYRLVTGRIRAERLAREWEEEILKGIWIDWKRATKRRILVNKIGEVVAEGVELNLIRRTFYDWYRHVAEIKDRELVGPIELLKKSGERLKREVYEKLKLVLTRRGIQDDLAESCRLGYEDDTKRTIFNQWLEKSRYSREINLRLEEFEFEKKRRLMERKFDIWRELSLRGLEKRVKIERDERLIRTTWKIWFGRSKLLPFMDQQRSRTKRAMFIYWLDQVPDPHLVRRAEELDWAVVTRGCLDVWKIRFQAKSAIRSVNRFRNYASTSHNSHNSSNSAPTTPSFINTTPTRPVEIPFDSSHVSQERSHSLSLSQSESQSQQRRNQRSPTPAFSNNSYGSGHYFSPPPLPSPFAPESSSTPSPPPFNPAPSSSILGFSRGKRSSSDLRLNFSTRTTRGYFDSKNVVEMPPGTITSERDGEEGEGEEEGEDNVFGRNVSGSGSKRGLRARLSNLNLGDLYQT